MQDQFEYIVSNSFANAAGNVPPFKSGEKDPATGKGSEGNIGDLQRALNKIGGSPTLVDDGIFGANTVKSLKSLGYSSPVSSADFYKILSKANAGDSGSAGNSGDGHTLTEAEMKALWAKSTGKFGKLGKDADYDKWAKRQKTLAGIKDLGKGLFSVGTDWLKQKQAGSDIPYNPNEAQPIDDRILGMPKPVVYVGVTVIAGLVIWGIVALVTKKPRTIMVQAPAVAQ